MKKRKRVRNLYRNIAILFVIVVFFYWQNNGIEITNYDYINSNISDAFHGFKIVQISDLHNKEFGQNQSSLLDKMIRIEPDIIVITGDLFDRNRFDLERGLQFVRGAVQIAPVYYVSGNHEAWRMYDKIMSDLEQEGVILLEDDITQIERDGTYIGLLGVADPLTSLIPIDERLRTVLEDKMHDFNILLSHRPEYFETYIEQNLDLVLCGHTHGGQFRIPMIGGLYTTDEGFLPKYSSGIFQKENTSMIISRGLGNSVFPIRLFNRPEIVVVTLLNE